MVKPSSPLVIGIDFGMTCTGVAYAWNESMDVKLIQDDWPGSEGITQKKVPSIVVYKTGLEKGERKSSKKSSSNSHANAWKLSSWGFRAQEESERNDPKKKAHTFWKLFLDEEVVKAAYKDREDPSFTQEDVVTWYEDFFRELYDHIEAHFVATRPKLWESEVHFVFSVPTTWEEDIIDRFKKCFTKAGFGQKPGHTALVTLTEAQAAAVCTANEQNEEIEKGQYILICDAGGGTTDIALLEVDSDYGEPLKLKQIDRVWGKRAGSTQIDGDFERYACQQLEQLQKDHPDMLQDVQLIARSMTASRPFQLQKLTLGSKVSTIPFGVPVPGLPSDFSHKDSDIKGGKLMFTPKKLAAFFDERLKVIFDAVDTQLRNLKNLYENRQVDYMILSGGLGSSQYVKKKLEERYCKEKLYSNASDMTILRAETPQVVVAKGLVTDHLRTSSKDKNQTSVLQNWISPRSYGVVGVKPWNPYIHLKQDKEAPDELTGKAYAINQITWVIKKGESLTNKSIKKCGGMRRFRSDGSDYESTWSSHMVVSDRDVDDLPSSTSQGGVRPFCVIHSDLGQFDVNDFEEEKGNRLTGGQTHRVANYQFKVFKGAADIRLELWFRGKKRSEEKNIKVHWDHKLIRDEVF